MPIIPSKGFPPPASNPGIEGSAVWFRGVEYVYLMRMPTGHVLAARSGDEYPARLYVLEITAISNYVPTPVVSSNTVPADGTTAAIISGLKPLTKYEIVSLYTTLTGEITDGTLELTFTVPGSYVVRAFDEYGEAWETTIIAE